MCNKRLCMVQYRRARVSYDCTGSVRGNRPDEQENMSRSHECERCTQECVRHGDYQRLPNAYIEQRHPILNGLKQKANQDQADAKDAHASFGHMIGRPFDERRT
jgi:hypothetical protein